MNFTGFPPADKSFGGQFGDVLDRVSRLERRRLPLRLSPSGQEVTDWNDAIDPGFYWAQGTALNSPSNGGAAHQGIVTVGVAGVEPRIIQEVKAGWGDSRITETFRRRFNGTAWGSWYQVHEPSMQVNSFTVKYSTATSNPTTIGTMAIPATAHRTLWAIMVDAAMGFNASASQQRLSFASSAGVFSASSLNGLDVSVPAGAWYPFGQTHRLTLDPGQAATLTMTGKSSIATGDNYIRADITCIPSLIP